MESVTPTLFHEIYRKCFGATYDTTQESTWHWLIAQHISDFYMPVYTRGDPLSLCITLHEGHRPKMFLWMVKEYAFVLCHLRRDDRNGFLVLGHELLLLVCSQCCQKRGGGRGSCRTGPTPLDTLPACTFQTLEHAVRAADTIQLERLVWAVFDNIIRLGKVPPLSRLETYSQIVGCLAGKAYKGLHMRCPACTSASFGAEVTRARPEGPDPKKPRKLQHYSMTRDVRKEFVGSYSALKEKQDWAGEDQSSAPVHPVDPNIQGMKWMKEHQCSYRDVQLDIWLLLRPLADGGEELTHQLARRLLSVSGIRLRMPRT